MSKVNSIPRSMLGNPAPTVEPYPGEPTPSSRAGQILLPIEAEWRLRKLESTSLDISQLEADVTALKTQVDNIENQTIPDLQNQMQPLLTEFKPDGLVLTEPTTNPVFYPNGVYVLGAQTQVLGEWRVAPILLPNRTVTIDSMVAYCVSAGADATIRFNFLIYDSAPATGQVGSYFPRNLLFNATSGQVFSQQYLQANITPPLTVNPGTLLWAGGAWTGQSVAGYTMPNSIISPLVVPNITAAVVNTNQTMAGLVNAASPSPPNPWGTAYVTANLVPRVAIRVSSIS